MGENVKIIAQNKKARFNYFIEESYECGLELEGTEVKSLRSGRFSFTDSYVKIQDGDLWLIGFTIQPYDKGSIFNHEPDRNRRLLVHKQEIKRLEGELEGQKKINQELLQYTKEVAKINSDKEEVAQQIQEAENEEELLAIIAGLVRDNNDRVRK